MATPASGPTFAATVDADFLQARFSTSIVEYVNVWLNVLDNELNIVLWNAAAEKLSGYARHEVLGHNLIWEWLYPDEEYRRSITEQVLAMLASEQALENFETRIRCRSGVTRVILWNSKSLTDEIGRVYGVITFGYDVTDLERARRSRRHTTTFRCSTTSSRWSATPWTWPRSSTARSIACSSPWAVRRAPCTCWKTAQPTCAWLPTRG